MRLISEKYVPQLSVFMTNNYFFFQEMRLFPNCAAGVTKSEALVMHVVLTKGQSIKILQASSYWGLSELSKILINPPSFFRFIDRLMDSTRCLPSTNTMSIEEFEIFFRGAR